MGGSAAAAVLLGEKKRDELYQGLTGALDMVCGRLQGAIQFEVPMQGAQYKTERECQQ